MNYQEVEIMGVLYIKKTAGESVYLIPSDPANKDYAEYLAFINDNSETQ